MTVESSFHSDPEDIFAKAIERVEAGESVEVVLATVPVAMHAELREILLLITATHYLQRAPVPQPTAPRRAERKAAFLQAAAQIKAEMAPVTAPPRAVAKQSQARSPMTTWLQNFWRDLQMGFSSPNLRLAPLLIILVAVWLSAFGFVTVTQAAGLGDLAYPVKQWIKHQEISLSPIEARGKISRKHTDTLIADLILAANRLRAEEIKTGRKAALISTEELIFEQTAGDSLILGPLTVMMKYQPDPNVDVYADIYMPVMPSSEQQVEVTFQIIATEDAAAEPPFITQGMTVTIPVDQLEIGPTPTAEPTATTTPCIATQPVGWVPYAVRPGDTLSLIAQRTGTTVARLQQANCIDDPNVITSGKMLFAPSLKQINTPIPTQQEKLEVTLTAISTTVLTPSIDITATVSVVPTDTVMITATGRITAVLTAEATTNITATLEQTATVVATPTSPITTTPEVIGTSVTTSTATITARETATDTIDSAASTPLAPTVTASDTPAAETTPGATESTTPEGTVTTPTPWATPTATPTNDALETSTPAPTSTATGVGESTPTRERRQGGVPTPTSTPIPQNRSPLTGG